MQNLVSQTDMIRELAKHVPELGKAAQQTLKEAGLVSRHSSSLFFIFHVFFLRGLVLFCVFATRTRLWTVSWNCSRPE